MTSSLQSMGTRLRASVAVLLCVLPCALNAAPYKPSSDHDVLLQVDPAQTAARANLRNQSDRSDPKGAATAAARFIALGRAQHDERYFGYASATLKPWSQGDAPVDIQLLRADIAQYQHRFVEALGILNRAIDLSPNNSSARLMRANILQSQGQPQNARRDCQRLISLGEIFAGAVCLAQASGMNGQLGSSDRLVENLLQRESEASSPEVKKQLAWALGVHAEMALRLGNPRAAETALRRALTLDAEDYVSRIELCDVLLDAHRPNEALQIIEGLAPSDPVLLRRALAAQSSGDSSAARAALTMWKEAVERSAQLGVTLHLRELARGQLELLHDSKSALKTALANWQVQREPIDALLLAKAATAERDAHALDTIRAWQKSLGFEDARLQL